MVAVGGGVQVAGFPCSFRVFLRLTESVPSKMAGGLSSDRSLDILVMIQRI